MVVYILPANAKTVLGLFCNSKCILHCSHIMLSSSSRNVNMVERSAVLPTLRFSREFALVFLWSCGLFLKTCGLLVYGIILIEICLFFGLAFCRFLFCRLLFFQILWHFCRFNVLLKAYWACFCENLLILGLFFRICQPDFYLIFLLIFRFVEFSCERILGLLG